MLMKLGRSPQMPMLALKVVRGVVAEMVLVVEVVEVVLVVVVEEEVVVVVVVVVVVAVVVVVVEVEVRRWIWHLCHSSIGSKPMTYQL